MIQFAEPRFIHLLGMHISAAFYNSSAGLYLLPQCATHLPTQNFDLIFHCKLLIATALNENSLM